ncbi:MAG TPA: DUF6356 family protein [Azospirillaceae bacterium]|nr:DUF6356 family protein [Azospirillaceae bacterium]
MIRRVFLEHPESVNETYGQHMAVAGGFGLRLVAAGLACLVHALIPCLFERTGSRMVRELHDRLSRRVHGADAKAPAADSYMGWSI